MKYFKGAVYKDDGSVLPLFALIFFTMFIVGAFIIESGNFYIRDTQVNHLAQQAAYSGSIVFWQDVSQRAEINKNSQCTVVPPATPPAICSSNEVFDFIGSSELLAIISNVSTQSKMETAAKNFVHRHDPDQKISLTDVSIDFPYQYTGLANIYLRVSIETSFDQMFSGIIPLANDAVVEHGLASLKTPY